MSTPDQQLIQAISQRREDEVQRLLAAGANANAATAEGDGAVFAVQQAAALHDVRIVRLLLQAGANPRVTRPGNLATPLHEAAKDDEVLAALLEAGADPCARDKSLWTPLHRVACTGSGTGAGLLLSAGADPTAVDKSNLSPLAIAAFNGRAPVVERLLQCPNLPLDLVDTWKKTPVLDAANRGHFDVVRLLLFAGAKPPALNHLTSNLAHVTELIREAAARPRTAPTLLSIAVAYINTHRDLFPAKPDIPEELAAQLTAWPAPLELPLTT